jgi:predicted negative regulator of RcsB-dependent stress response
MSTDLQVSSDTPDSGPLAEISQGPNAFEAFLDRNQKNLIILAALCVIGAITLVVYRGIEQSRQQTAGAALNKAEDLNALQAVVNEHGKTTAAGSAMLLLANSQWTAGKKDEAVATLQKFISTSQTHPALYSAKANLGAKLMAQGKTNDATKAFEELASNPAARFIAPFALISLGDISKAAGDLEKAGTYYSDAKSKFPESSFADTAAKRLASLKAKSPTEIEPPPAPAPPAAPALPADPAPGAVTAPPAPITPAAPTPEEQVSPPTPPNP